MYMNTYIHIHEHIHAYVYIYIYIYTHTYVLTYLLTYWHEPFLGKHNGMGDRILGFRTGMNLFRNGMRRDFRASHWHEP